MNLKKYALTQILEVLRISTGAIYAILTYGLVGAEAFGFFSALGALAAYGFLFEGTQLIQGFQIDFRKSRCPHLFTSTLSIVCTFAIILIPLVFLLCFFGTSYEAYYCAGFALMHSATPLRNFFTNYLVIDEKISISIISEIFSKLLALSIFYLVYFQRGYADVDLLFIAMGSEMAANLLFVGSFVLKRQPLGSFQKKQALSLFNYAWPLMTSNFFSGFIFRSIKVVFLKNLSTADFGRLSFIDNALEKLKGPASLYIQQRLPNMIDGIKSCGFIKTSKNEFILLSKFSLFLCALITLGILIVDPFMSHPFMARFAEVKHILYFLAYFIVIRAYAGLATQLTIAARKNHIEAFGAFLSICIQFTLASYVVINFGLYGALFAVCANSILTGISLFSLAVISEKRKIIKMQNSR